MVTNQKTEKILLGTLSLLLFVLVWNVYVTEPRASADEDEMSVDDGGSTDESTADSGDDANSEQEVSEPSAPSAPSEKSVPSTTQTKTRTPAVTATSETSTSQQGVSVSSVNDDTGELGAESVKSLKSEDSTIATVSTEGNVSMVKRDGKLFFLIPVEIESQVTTNESGSVIAEKRNFLNWLKAFLSV